MFEHGDDLTIEGHRISWLIWIQILVFLLLLLFCFSFFPADLPDTTTTTATTSSSASPSTPGVFMPLNFHLENQILEQNDRVSNRLQHSQVQQNQSIKGEITTSTGRRIASEDNIEYSSDHICFHPCNYFRLAKLAFLKCFGLDFLSDNSLN